MNSRRRIRLFVLIVLVGTISLRAVQTPPTFAQAEPIPVIIDTDMALDDWMAIAFLLQHPAVDVVALTVAGTGEAHCNPGIANAMNLVAMLGHPDVPVACGRESPLSGNNTFPLEWRTNVDAMAGLQLPVSDEPHREQTAVELLAETISSSDTAVTIVTLGPLTNIADLIAEDASIASGIERIYVMGGAVHVMGNLTPFVTNNYRGEWNIYVDPVAAANVINSGVPVTLVPLDATNDVPITLEFHRRLMNDRTTAAADFVYQVLSANLGFIASGGYYFWDPMAAVAVVDSDVVTVQDEGVRVVTDIRVEEGRTMPDPTGHVVRVAVDADGARFERVFLNVLNGRDPLADLPEIPEVGADLDDASSTMVPVTSTDEIVGTWRLQYGLFHLKFDADGRFVASQALSVLNSDTPEDLGTYTVDEGTVRLTSGERSQFCSAGDIGEYVVHFNARGELVFVLVSDECDMRAAPPERPQPFNWVAVDGSVVRFPIGEVAARSLTMDFRGNGTYEFSSGDSVISIGTFRIRGDRLLWVSDSYCDAQGAAGAEYRWTFDGITLTFEPMDADLCADRANVLVEPYTLVR